MSDQRDQQWIEKALAPLTAEVSRLKVAGVTEIELRKALTILAASVGMKTTIIEK